MPLSTQSQDDEEHYVLVASLDNARNLSNILKAITFKDHAVFTATPNGLKVTVEDSKCLQANAFIQVCVQGVCFWICIHQFCIRNPDWREVVIFSLQTEIFQEFTLKEDLVTFQINLTVLLDCLNIFGGNAVAGKEFFFFFAQFKLSSNPF